MKTIFKVNDKPFFTIGGQAHNSSSQSAEVMQKAWKAVKTMGMNTLAAPVCWETIEPVEGQFDFTQADLLVEGARENGVKLIILWFGTWKNGASQYVPNWVTLQKDRFVWAETVQHNLTMILSPHCEETRKADMKAYLALVQHLKEIGAEDVLIGIQVENEPGLGGTPRDYSAAGEAVYRSQVPAELIEWLETVDDCYEKQQWIAAGAKKAGTWEEIFGFFGAEAVTAYGVSNYINSISKAGKEILDLPTYINIWLGEMYNRVPGVDYPCGGCTKNVISMWKHYSPDIDAVCPDVYIQDFQNFDKVMTEYSREDNILYVPESGASEMNAVNVLTGIVRHKLSGIHIFGVEDCITDDGEVRADEYKGTVTALKNFKYLLENMEETDQLFDVAQYEGAWYDWIDCGDFYGRIVYYKQWLCNGEAPNPHMDFEHKDPVHQNKRGKGLILYKGNGEFYLTGEGYNLILIRKETVEGCTSGVISSAFQNNRHQRYLQLEEGTFNDEGEFTVRRIRTGDECDYGLWMARDIGVLHVRIDM